MTLVVKGNLPNILKNNRRLMKTLPRKIAVMSLEHYLKAFDKGAGKGGGQTDDSLDGWKARKKETKNSRTRALLVGVGSGHFRRNLNILLVNPRMIKLGTKGIPYASFHNEGTNKMVKREVLGDSLSLRIKIGQLAAREAKKQNRR